MESRPEFKTAKRRRVALGWGVGLAVLACWPVGALAQAPPDGARGVAVAGPAFVAIRVRDDSAASAWYQRALGLTEVRHLEPDDRRYSIRLLRGDGLIVELIRAGTALAADAPALGLFKAGFHVADIDAAFTWLRELGVDTDRRVFFDEALNVRSFVFRDPEGNRLQVFQPCDTSCQP